MGLQGGGRRGVCQDDGRGSQWRWTREDGDGRIYCLPTAYVRYVHSQSSLLCSSLPHYSESVHLITWAQVDVRSYGTQLKPSSNDASI